MTDVSKELVRKVRARIEAVKQHERLAKSQRTAARLPRSNPWDFETDSMKWTTRTTGGKTIAPKATVKQVLAGVERANTRITEVVKERERLAKGTKRDATTIFELADEGYRSTEQPKLVRIFGKVRQLAKRMDARTGKRDPSTRKRKKT